jgi:hypothetical protein
MDVGVIATVVVLKTLQHRDRLLGGGRVIKIDQGVAIDLLVQNWKIDADLLGEGTFLDDGHRRRAGAGVRGSATIKGQGQNQGSIRPH